MIVGLPAAKPERLTGMQSKLHLADLQDRHMLNERNESVLFASGLYVADSQDRHILRERSEACLWHAVAGMLQVHSEYGALQLA